MLPIKTNLANPIQITHDGTWTALGVSEQSLRATTTKLSEQGSLPQSVHQFFEQAGALMMYSWYNYPFASIAFFHTVLGSKVKEKGSGCVGVSRREVANERVVRG